MGAASIRAAASGSRSASGSSNAMGAGSGWSRRLAREALSISLFRARVRAPITHPEAVTEARANPDSRIFDQQHLPRADETLESSAPQPSTKEGSMSVTSTLVRTFAPSLRRTDRTIDILLVEDN